MKLEIFLLGVLFVLGAAVAFTVPSTTLTSHCRSLQRVPAVVPHFHPSLFVLSAKSETDDREYWLGEFSTSTGEVVEPYKVLGGECVAANARRRCN